MDEDHAASAWNDVFLSYYPGPVTIAGLEAIHRLHLAHRALYPGGTVTLGVIGSGIPVPGREVRSYAAEIGRKSSGELRGECIVLEGHPFWVGMARSAFRAIQLVSHAWHPREVFGAIEPAARWSLSRVGRGHEHAGELVSATHTLMHRWADEHGRRGG